MQKHLLSALVGVFLAAGMISTGQARTSSPEHSTGPLHLFTVDNALVHWTGYGLRDSHGKVVLPVQSHKLTPLANGGWLETGAHRRGRLLDAHGKPVSKYFAYIEQVQPNLGTLLLGTQGAPLLSGKGGLIRDDGSVVAKPEYLKLRYMDGDAGLFSFVKFRRYGVLDAHGKVVLKPQWDGVKALHGLILASRYGKQTLFDRHGKKLASPQPGVSYQAIKDSPWISRCTTSDESREDACTVLDQTLQPVIKGQFASIQYLPKAKRLLLQLPGKKGYALYAANGKRLAKLDINNVRGNTDGRYIRVSQAKPGNAYASLAGVIDSDGQWIIKPQDGNIRKLSVAFSERDEKSADKTRFELRVRQKNGDYLHSVIGPKGKTILKPKGWDFLYYYPSLDVYLVQTPDRKIGVVDHNGHWRIKPFKGHTARNSQLPSPYRMLVARQDGKDSYRLYNLASGKRVFDNTYQYIDIETSYWPFGAPAPWPEFVVVVAERDGKYGVINLDGDVIVPFKYKNIEALDRWGYVRVTDAKGHETRVNALGKKRSQKLHRKVARYMQTHPAPVAGPRMPYAGRYVPVAYQSKDAVQAAYQSGKLAWPAAPTILVSGRITALDLNMVVNAKRPRIDFIEYYCPRENGFDVMMPGAGYSRKACVTDTAPRLIFKAGKDKQWHCDTCADYGLPENWLRLPNPPPPSSDSAHSATDA